LAGEIEKPADVTVTYDEAADEFVISFEFGPHFKRALDLVKQIEGRSSTAPPRPGASRLSRSRSLACGGSGRPPRRTET
jgi:hypothetical protein